MVRDAVVIFAAVNLVREGVELRANLAKLRDDDLFVLAARARVRRRAAFHVQIEAPRADQRQRRRKVEAERKHFARVNQFRRFQSHLRLHQISGAHFILRAPF